MYKRRDLPSKVETAAVSINSGLEKKPPEEPSFYRSFCMLVTAGKIFKCTIYQRIEADNQYGFRKGRSTLVAINLVFNSAKESPQDPHGRVVQSSNAKNAFNSANWETLCIMGY